MQSIPFKPRNWNRHLTTGLTSITSLVFILEVVTPPGIATSIAYVFVILLCYLDDGKKKLYFFSFLCMILVTADVFISHSGVNHNPTVFINRAISIICIGMAAIFTYRFKMLTKKHRNNEGLLKSILSSANEAVVVTDENDKIIYNNERAEKIFSFNKYELISRNVRKLIPDEFNAHIENEINTKPLKIKQSEEIIAIRKDGTEFPASISRGCFYNQKGTFFTYFLMDITFKKATEAEVKLKNDALLKSENFLGSILQNIPLHILVREPETNNVVLENKKILDVIKVCDFDPAEITSGNVVCDCITLEQTQEILHANTEVIRTGKPVIIPEFHMSSQKGTEIVMRIIKAPIIDALGDTNYIINICEDITGRIIDQRELKKKNDLLLESQEIGNVGSFESDLFYRTIVLSKEMINIVGVEPEESYPFNILMDYIYPEDRLRVNTGLKKAIEEKTLCDEKYRIIKPNGELRHVWLKAKSICDEEGKPRHLRGVISDITELKTIEDNLTEYVEGLKEMMFMTSHKVRLPIANIIGIANILEQSMRSPEVLKKMVNYLKISALSLDAFTKELTGFMEHLKTDEGQYNNLNKVSNNNITGKALIHSNIH